MAFLLLALRNLVRRPLRATLAACGVALAVGSFVSLLGMSRGHARAWERSLTGQGTDILVSRKGGVELLATSIDESEGERLARLDGVSAVAGELLDLVALESGQNVIVSGRPTASYLWTSLTMAEGRLPEAGADKAVALGQSMADALGMRGGAHLTVEGSGLVATGVVRTTGTLTSHMLFMPLPAMQRLVRRPGVVTVFNIRLRPPADAEHTEAFVRAASRAFPHLTFTRSQSLDQDNPILQAANALAWAVSAIALTIGLVGVLNALLMSVTERVREIGILAAVGWAPARVLGLIVCEGVLLASAGSVAGLAGGWIALRGLAASPRVAGLLEPEMTGSLAFEVAVATLLLGGISSLYPAWRAIRLSPVEALKHE